MCWRTHSAAMCSHPVAIANRCPLAQPCCSKHNAIFSMAVLLLQQHTVMWRTLQWTNTVCMSSHHSELVSSRTHAVRQIFLIAISIVRDTSSSLTLLLHVHNLFLLVKLA